jgi:hypothetical protein
MTTVPGPLFELILAVNYLDIKSLLDVTCKGVAKMIQGKKPAINITNFMRELYGTQNTLMAT